MDEIEIQGGYPLQGELKIQGSKNAVLPLLAACILYEGTTILEGVPDILDVHYMVALLRNLGCEVFFENHRLMVNAEELKKESFPKELAEKIRSSVLFLGPLLGRRKKGEIPYPGGCMIGKRPINFHLTALETLGARIICDASIRAETAGLHGAVVHLPFPSVGATENTILAAVRAKGQTMIEGAAKEPEIAFLCEALTEMGADITGGGTEHIVIRGVNHLRSAVIRIPPDRIVTATYLAAFAITGGKGKVTGVRPEELHAPMGVFSDMGCKIETGDDWIALQAPGRLIGFSPIATGPYPAFPTDLQSIFMSLAAVAAGESILNETLYEERFLTADQLKSMGAKIETVEQNACITGVKRLKGSPVEAKDLRGGAALVLAALAAFGKTNLCGTLHIERGYEYLWENLNSLGGKIRAGKAYLYDRKLCD